MWDFESGPPSWWVAFVLFAAGLCLAGGTGTVCSNGNVTLQRFDGLKMFQVTLSMINVVADLHVPL